ncbi:unnamed protein product [Amoebophrya sp. A25]|nr:unnamed protein product [Amoebophrya sp. A25]|eukprot:GSA25T00013409001.1
MSALQQFPSVMSTPSSASSSSTRRGRFAAGDKTKVAGSDEAHSKALDLVAHVALFDEKVIELRSTNQLLRTKLEQNKLETAEVMRELEFTRFQMFYRWRDVVAREYRNKKLKKKKDFFAQEVDSTREKVAKIKIALASCQERSDELEKERDRLGHETSELKTQLAELEREERRVGDLAQSQEHWIMGMRLNARERSAAMQAGRTQPGVVSLQHAAQVKAGLTKVISRLDDMNRQLHAGQPGEQVELEDADTSYAISPSTPPDPGHGGPSSLLLQRTSGAGGSTTSANTTLQEPGNTTRAARLVDTYLSKKGGSYFSTPVLAGRGAGGGPPVKLGTQTRTPTQNRFSTQIPSGGQLRTTASSTGWTWNSGMK